MSWAHGTQLHIQQGKQGHLATPDISPHCNAWAERTFPFNETATNQTLSFGPMNRFLIKSSLSSTPLTPTLFISLSTFIFINAQSFKSQIFHLQLFFTSSNQLPVTWFRLHIVTFWHSLVISKDFKRGRYGGGRMNIGWVLNWNVKILTEGKKTSSNGSVDDSSWVTVPLETMNIIITQMKKSSSSSIIIIKNLSLWNLWCWHRWSRGRPADSG